MTKERLCIYDTTLRDGQQTYGVDFSAEEKRQILASLDDVGVDYIEGGWPGANPTDTDFFKNPPKLFHARLSAFGMTRRAGQSVGNDDLLMRILESQASSVCLVGKTHLAHVKNVLNTSPQDNLQAIQESVSWMVEQGREVIFDAEHFFDSAHDDWSYALACLDMAIAGGARWVVLCDTNGGGMPADIGERVRQVCQHIPRNKVGIHTHNDTEQAVANSLAAILNGARQIQGTINGLGERCGNANLISIIPTLVLKKPFCDMFEIGISQEGLKKLLHVSRFLDEKLNRVPNNHAPYVGSSAFAHKAGLHASAVLKNPAFYEHIDPAIVGNERVFPISNQSGRANLLKTLRSFNIPNMTDALLNKSDLTQLLDAVKDMEEQGFSYDMANASFVIFACKFLGILPEFFMVEKYQVHITNTYSSANSVSEAEAELILKIGQKTQIGRATAGGDYSNDGPVHALFMALCQCLGEYNCVRDWRLVDFKVRILTTGTKAITRVLIVSSDSQENFWTTVGVSPNIIEASFQALVDSVKYRIFMSENS